MKIVIESIPHDQQRYETVGDWIVEKPDALTIRVSHMQDGRHMFLVALHELIEATLCAHDGVKQSVVDEFDKVWQPHDGIEEPGDDPKAPYHKQHSVASFFERCMAIGLGVDWAEYEKALDAL